MVKKLTEEKKYEIYNLYKQGKSIEKIAMKTNVPPSSVYELTRLKERGFDSFHKYQEYLVIQNGFKSYREYQEDLARLKGFKSEKEYSNTLIKKKSKRKENVSLSNFIKKALKDLNKGEAWLAKELGVSRQLISIYIHGKSFPGQEKFEKLLSILVPNSELRPKSVEDLVSINYL